MPTKSMIRICSLIALIATVSLTGFASSVDAAPQQDNRLFGGGRFLRRLRNEITGDKDKQKEPTPADKKQTAKSPTPAPKPNVQKPSLPKFSNPFNRTPLPAQAKNRNAAPTPADAPKRNTPAMNASRLTRPAANQRDISLSAGRPARSAAKPTLGFGMLVEDRKDQLVVKQLDPAGNARKAGIRVGDQIISGGGVEFGSVEEFNEIVDILKPGDQLEFEIKRGRDDDKLIIAFGEAPESEESIEDQPASVNAPLTSQVNTKENYSFLPDKNTNRRSSGLHSVLDSPLRAQPRPGNDFQITPNQTVGQTQLQSTIQQQQQEIERLKRELQRIKQQSGDAIGSGTLNGPSLSGPG